MTPTDPDLSRRLVLRGAALTGLSIPLVAACGSDADPPSAGGTSSGGGSTPSGPAEGPSGGGGGGGGGLVATSDVPVGGGTILSEEKVVVTQPSDGEFKAFTAVCTHQGCVVAEVIDGTITCGCHNSMFSIDDGSVVGGPAPAPLAEMTVSVEGDQISVS